MKRITEIIIVVTGLAFISTPHLRGDDFLGDFLKDAQSELDTFKEESIAENAAFKEKTLSEHAAFRDSAMSALRDWVSQPWEPRPMQEPQPSPFRNIPDVDPVIIPHDNPQPQPHPGPLSPNPLVVPVPAPVPTNPLPVLPPVMPDNDIGNFTFSLYGTMFKVTAGNSLKNNMGGFGRDREQVAVKELISSWDNAEFDRLSSTLQLEARNHNFTPWAFYRLVKSFCENFLPGKINEQRVLQGMLMISAGYDVRFAYNNEGRIFALTGIPYLLTEESYYTNDGNRYYPLEKVSGAVYMVPEKFGGTALMDVQPSGEEQFDPKPAESRQVKVWGGNPDWIKSGKSAALTVSYTTDLNRMDYLSDCPQYLVNGIDYSNWHTYVNTPISESVRSEVYPVLKSAIDGKSELEAANILLKFVQAFPYKRDADAWGHERAFFPEETLHYPYRDCEDGAILYVRLVKDLLGLPAALVYYPGHLAAAVSFNTDVTGAYLISGHRKYTICDPTYYSVNVGVQMPSESVDSSKAVLIPFNK